MAEFGSAFNITMGHEGGYSNDPKDPGGETYRGISRVHHPEWPGWPLIDGLKVHPDFPRSLRLERGLQNMVSALYKAEYWDRFRGDDIPDQEIANELFDTGVNMGVKPAVEFLQRSLNLLNRNERSYLNISADGMIGPRTLEVLDKFLAVDSDGTPLLFKIMNIYQAMHYIDIMEDNPEREIYARGWFRRVYFIKEVK